MSSSLKIRLVTPGDAHALVALIGGFRDHLGAKVPTDIELERHLPRTIADSGIEFSCAWLNGEAVGYTQTRFFSSVWAGGTEAHLEDLFVIPSARGERVGRFLLRHALARAEARGALRFSLTTNERNDAAQSLYRSEGLSPQSHVLYPGGREILWVRRMGAA